MFVEKFAVPSPESLVQLGFWSILSTANVVETFEQSFVAQITPSDSNCVYTHPHVTLIKLIFDHKIKTNLNHGTCIRARDFGFENSI